jgi:hypothetical protein
MLDILGKSGSKRWKNMGKCWEKLDAKMVIHVENDFGNAEHFWKNDERNDGRNPNRFVFLGQIHLNIVPFQTRPDLKWLILCTYMIYTSHKSSFLVESHWTSSFLGVTITYNPSFISYSCITYIPIFWWSKKPSLSDYNHQPLEVLNTDDYIPSGKLT